MLEDPLSLGGKVDLHILNAKLPDQLLSHIDVGTAAAGVAMAAAHFYIKLLIFMIFTLYR